MLKRVSFARMPPSERQPGTQRTRNETNGERAREEIGQKWDGRDFMRCA